MSFERVAETRDVPPGKTKFLCSQGVPIILANWQGRIYALYGLCPHRDNPLEGAALWDNLIDCPYHHFQYDVVTGQNYFPKNVYPGDYPELREQLQPLKTYPVEVRGDEIWVDLNMSSLADQKCVPCRGGVPPLEGEALAKLAGQLPDWKVIEDGRKLNKTYPFPDFQKGLDFVNRVGAVAEAEGHHPDLCLSWGRVDATIYTHKINGLTESDFFMAAKIDRAYFDK